MQEAAEEGWDIDNTTGDLLDEDDEYSRDSRKRRKLFRADISAIRRTLDDGGCAKSDEEAEDGGTPIAAVEERNIVGLCGPVDPNDVQIHMEVAAPKDISPHEASQIVYMDNVDNELFTREWVDRAINQGVQRWCPRENTTPLMTFACRRYGIDWDGVSWPPTIDRSILHRNYRAELAAFDQVISRACQSDTFGEVYRDEINRVAASIYASYNMLIQASLWSDAFKLVYSPPNDPCMELHRPNDRRNPELEPFHHIIYLLLSKINEFRYRRRGEMLYEQVTNCDGVFVHTYRECISIEQFMYTMVNAHERHQLWQGFCKEGNTPAYIVRYLTKCNEPMLPDLKKDRYVHSFRNGLYFVKDDRFRAWTDGYLDANITACKYHPYDFVAHDGLVAVDFVGKAGDDACEPRVSGTAWDIPTPLFDRIMDAQKFPYGARVWLYVMMGRLLYWAKEMDNWQVWMFHFGLASVGKSTLCNIFGEYFYEKDDMGNFGNGIERQFGIWAIHDKMGVFCSEVDKDFNIDRTELQQMISAERISVRGKNLKAQGCDFTAPGMLAGNYIPTWKDVYGAMARRLMIWHYKYEVTVDQELLKKIASEIPTIILKCNRFYRAAVKHVGRQGIWAVLPSYFRETRMMLQSETSTLHGFFRSDDVTIVIRDGEPDENVYVPMAVLRERYQKWKVDNDVKAGTRWAKEEYTKALRDMGLKPPSKVRRKYPRDSSQDHQQQFIFGIDLTEEVERLENARFGAPQQQNRRAILDNDDD